LKVILIYTLATVSFFGPPQQAEAAARRIASTTQLAAQEYGLGVSGGRVVATAEIEETRLFLTEASRSAAHLPAPVALEVQGQIRAVLAMVDRVAPADSVRMSVDRLVDGLGRRLGIALEELPSLTPSLARGAALYQASCARCHGDLGKGDGRDGLALVPRPASLADAIALRERSPLDFYRRITIGVAGTAMPPFEQGMSAEDRWAAALYASTLRLPGSAGTVPPALSAFATSAKMSDAQLLQALGAGATLAQVAAIRSAQAEPAASPRDVARIFDVVRGRVDSAYDLARKGETEQARQLAFDAYLTFEQVERDVRARDAGLAAEAEAAFAALRERAGAVGEPELAVIKRDLEVVLEKAERVVGDQLSPLNLLVQSFVILLREGLEAILLIGALMAFLVRTGSVDRRRDIHIGVGLAIGASLLTAVALETVLHLAPGRQELIEGFTMAVATVVLFYVSYWLLSKFEIANWARFVKAKVQDAVSSGSALALASVAFLAVYREGFETVLFYKALMVSGGTGALLPVLGGVAAGGVVLAVVYVAINRYGVRLPLKPFFAVTSAFLYYMAFVFAGKAVAELQEGSIIGTTLVGWAPRIPMLGIYPTVESLAAQALLVLLAAVALAWIFVLEPARARRVSGARTTAPDDAGTDQDLLRSLERIDVDLAEARAEVERLKERVGAGKRVGR
jgi:high-affinity iron transporter